MKPSVAAGLAAATAFLLVALPPTHPLSSSPSPPRIGGGSRPSTAAAAAAVGRRDALVAGLSNAAAALLLGVGAVPPSADATPRLDGYDPLGAVARPSAGRSYFPPLTPPLADRATYRYDLGRDAWALEQLLVFANVSATVRTVVVRTEGGGLWVNGPQWPTGEFCALLDELGPVRHVVLPCNALEHKALMAAFVRRYPDADVWVAPGQYGPFGSCGLDAGRGCKMGYRVDGVLPVGRLSSSATTPPWADEFDVRTLYVELPENAGPVSESAFYHRPSNTLITTDSVVFVPDSAPPIFGTYFNNKMTSDTDFWPKSVLQAVFLPLRRGGGDGANDDERWPGYGAVRGRLLRAPILRAFADARAPRAVRDWASDIASMGEFDRVLTSHFASPIAATPGDFAGAFRYLYEGGGDDDDPPIACGDWAVLDSLNRAIEDNKLGAPVVFDFKRGCRP